ncbi:MAG: rod shape-determining protein RodA [Gammaproteobacteria bacterium]|nr:rod shape-determining protein RodA [Gammaproteobacteria bacterium]MBQ0841059.1 rod shape-determining protein RodA [Gammaproteobacteria bacterium]
MSQGDFERSLKEHGSSVYGERKRWLALRVDVPLLLLLLLLMAIGISVLFSASGQDFNYVKRQGVFMGIGLFAMLAVAQFDPRFIQRWAFVLYVGGIGLLIAVIFIGVGAKGAQRWLDLGFFRFQPSEVLKVAVPLMLSSYLAQRVLPPHFKHVVVALLLIGTPAILVGIQPDLGTALLIFAAGFFVLFLAGLGRAYLLGALFAGLSIAPIFWFYLLRDYQKTRILTLLDPQSDKLGAGWNIIQSTTAIGAGGSSGKGWMQGTQSQLDFLPESHTDFIIAVLSEEFGFTGVLCLLLVYLLIILRGMMISLNAQSMFGRLLAGSITLTFFVYVFVNMGMVSGILPVVGVPLPMVSYGGTSIVTLMLGFGMLMAVSKEKKRMGEQL